jgi:hypothetical protein
MSNHHKHTHSPYCLNCHYPTAEFDSFCPNCGQKNTDGKTTIHDLWHEFVHSWLHLDGKIFSTLKNILIPARLTLEFFKGRHKRYIHPIQLLFILGSLFVFTSVIYSKKSLTGIDLFLKALHQQAQNSKFVSNIDSVTKDLAIQNPKLEAFIDSIQNRLIDKSKQDFKKSLITVIDSGGQYNAGLAYGRNAAKSDSANKKSKSYSKGNEIGHNIGQMIWGKKQQKKDSTQSELTLLNPIEDRELNVSKNEMYGIPIMGMEVSFLDLELMNGEDLSKKYHPKNWKQIIALKQSARLIQDGGNFMSVYYSKLFWAILFSIFPMAIILSFLYRKRLMVEHLIFWLHISCANFFFYALSTLPNFLGLNLGVSIFLGLAITIFFNFIYTPLALSRYYVNENWKKLKILMVIITSFLISLFVAVIGLVISAALF